MWSLPSGCLEELKNLPCLGGNKLHAEICSPAILPSRTHGALCLGVAPRGRQLCVQVDTAFQISNELALQLLQWRPVAGRNAIDSIRLNGVDITSLEIEGLYEFQNDLPSVGTLCKADGIVSAFLLDADLSSGIMAAGSIAIRSAELDEVLFTNVCPIGINCPIHPAWCSMIGDARGRTLVVATLESGSLSQIPDSWNVWRQGRHIGGAQLIGQPMQLDCDGLATQGHACGHARLLAKSLAVRPVRFQRVAVLNKSENKFDVVTEIALDTGKWHEKDKNILMHAANRLYRKIFPTSFFEFTLFKENSYDIAQLH